MNNRVDKYLELALKISCFNSYDEKIDEYNRMVSQMRCIATEINKEFPKLKSEFCELLCHENKKIRLWVAHHILEVMNFEKSVRKSALREIRNNSRANKNADGLGEKLWLKEWYKSHPKDRWI